MSCENHKKELFGQTDMKVVAEAIGDLHYETFRELLIRLEVKLLMDSKKDAIGQKMKLSDTLLCASVKVGEAAHFINQAWQISKPFMDKKEQP